MRNYRELLKDVLCWDKVADHLARVTGQPGARLLQNREEMIQFCEWIETHQIRSYLEIGIWTGKLVSTLHQLFHFDKVAVCDLAQARTLCQLEIQVPPDTVCFWGDSQSQKYREWRQQLGPIDLVFIDGNHSYKAVRQDFEINMEYPCKYLAFHDICNDAPSIRGVKRLWEELEGDKKTICLPFKEEGLENVPRMGIGIISKESARLVEQHA